jgi:putative ABC transport system permease protein
MGRLQPGTASAAAQADVDSAMQDLARIYPAANANVRGEVMPFSQSPRGPQRFMNNALLGLQGVMLLLLLAVCGNTANLVLARVSARQREVGVRLALGASPARIARLLLTETLILALLGTALGVAFAWWGTEALRASPPMRGLPIRFETSINAWSLTFAALLGVGSGLIAGAAPAIQLARLQPQLALRAGTGGLARGHIRHTLIAVQVALSLVVLVAAGLSVRSFLETRDTDPGFRRDGVLLASYDLTGRSATEAASKSFATRLLERTRTLPGVEAAAISVSVPLDIHGLPQRFFAVDGRAREDGSLDLALTNTVTPGYFDVMGIPLLAGNGFAPLDDVDSPGQVVVNEEFVRRYVPGLPPIGKRVVTSGRPYMIAGVVKNSLNNAFGEPPTAIIYFSFRDRPGPSGHLHLRTRPGTETALAPGLRQAVRDLDSDVPVFNLRTMTEQVESNLIFRRVPARMFAVLGPLLLVLTSIGIYAVVAYTVSLRTAEIGVRIALGASRQRLAGDIVRQSLVIVSGGVAAGLILTVAAARSISPVLVLQPLVMVGVPVVVLAVAALASWVPARRASRVDPVAALRQTGR